MCATRNYAAHLPRISPLWLSLFSPYAFPCASFSCSRHARHATWSHARGIAHGFVDVVCVWTRGIDDSARYDLATSCTLDMCDTMHGKETGAQQFITWEVTTRVPACNACYVQHNAMQWQEQRLHSVKNTSTNIKLIIYVLCAWSFALEFSTPLSGSTLVYWCFHLVCEVGHTTLFCSGGAFLFHEYACIHPHWKAI